MTDGTSVRLFQSVIELILESHVSSPFAAMAIVACSKAEWCLTQLKLTSPLYTWRRERMGYKLCSHLSPVSRAFWTITPMPARSCTATENLV